MSGINIYPTFVQEKNESLNFFLKTRFLEFFVLLYLKHFKGKIINGGKYFVENHSSSFILHT